MKYTIIITTYNKSQYLTKCIESILKQTSTNYSIIVIDDGSTDNTKKVLHKYLNLPNFKYYYKKNTGVADSRNFGISKVKTPYFLFVDSDDYIANDLLSEADKYTNYDLLSFKAYRVDENYQITQNLNKTDSPLINGHDYLYSLMKNCDFFLVPWGYIYNTNFFRKHKFQYAKNYVNEDFGLTPLIILKSQRIISINYYGYYYYQSHDSITRSPSPQKIALVTKSTLYHYDHLINYLSSQNYDQKFIKLFNHFFSNLLICHGCNLNFPELNLYIKELKKRKIIKKIKVINFKSFIKIFLCSINYSLYYHLYFKLYHPSKKVKLN